MPHTHWQSLRIKARINHIIKVKVTQVVGCVLARSIIFYIERIYMYFKFQYVFCQRQTKFGMCKTTYQKSFDRLGEKFIIWNWQCLLCNHRNSIREKNALVKSNYVCWILIVFLNSSYPFCRCYTSAVPKVQCPKFLDLNGPMQIGGLPNFQSQFQIVNRNYKGCIKDFYVDHQLLDLNKFVFNNGTVAGCAEKTDQCISAPCKHGGRRQYNSRFLVCCQ